MKPKYKSAKHKQQAEELKAEWEAMLAKQNAPLFGRKLEGTARTAPAIPKLDVPRRINAKSLSTPGGDTALASPKVYTGTNMLGIATMHKSNSVPVFSSQEASDISSMRR